MAAVKPLKVSAKSAERIIDLVLSDDRLVEYVIGLVGKRLTKSMRADPEWCNTVIDLSIDQVLNEVNVFELISELNYIPQKKKSSKRREHELVEEQAELRPTFSSTEPKSVGASSPRRVVKELNKKKPVNIGGTAAEEPSPARAVPYNRSASVESDASTIPIVQQHHDGAIISKPTTTQEKKESWLSRAFADAQSESSISSDYAEVDMFASAYNSALNDSLRAETPVTPEDASVDVSAEESSPQPRAASSIHKVVVQQVGKSQLQTAESPASSAASPSTSTSTKIRRRGSLAYTIPVDANASTEDTPRSLESSTAALENEDFLSSWEKKVLQGMANGEEESAGEEEVGAYGDSGNGETGKHEPSPEELHEADRGEDRSGTGAGGKAQINDTGSDAEYSSDSTVISTESSDSDNLDDPDGEADGGDDVQEDYLRTAPAQTYTSGSIGGQVLFFDQSRFDADADFFSAEAENGTGKSPPGKHKSKSKAGRRKREVGDSPRRVRWSSTLISDVQYRDRVGYAEKGELFFTHNEEYQFTLDQNKEMERAEALGMSWMEWMDRRTDEDVQREEQAEADALAGFQLYTGDYYEEDESVENGTSSPLAPELQFRPDFKTGDAHASPVQLHMHPHDPHGLGAHPAGGVGGVGSAGGAVEVVFAGGDDLSVPSCSDEDQEYDFDDF